MRLAPTAEVSVKPSDAGRTASTPAIARKASESARKAVSHSPRAAATRNPPRATTGGTAVPNWVNDVFRSTRTAVSVRAVGTPNRVVERYQARPAYTEAAATETGAAAKIGSRRRRQPQATRCEANAAASNTARNRQPTNTRQNDAAVAEVRATTASSAGHRPGTIATPRAAAPLGRPALVPVPAPVVLGLAGAVSTAVIGRLLRFGWPGWRRRWRSPP